MLLTSYEYHTKSGMHQHYTVVWDPTTKRWQAVSEIPSASFSYNTQGMQVYEAQVPDGTLVAKVVRNKGDLLLISLVGRGEQFVSFEEAIAWAKAQPPPAALTP